MESKEYLRQQIVSCRRKMNTARLFNALVCFMAASGAGGFVCELVSLFVPFYYAHLAAALCFLAGALAGLVCAFLKRADMRAAAKCLDSFGLKERMLTAYELFGREDDFARLQREDALRHYQAARERIRIPLCPKRRHLAALALSLALVVGLGFVPAAARGEAKLRHEVEKLAKEEEKKVEELLDALAGVEMDQLSDEQKQQLAQLAEALKLSREELSAASTMDGLNAALGRLDYKYEQTAKGLENLAGGLADPMAAGITGAEALARALANNGETLASAGTPSAGDGGPDGEHSGDGDSGSSEGDGSGDGSAGSGGGDGDGSGSGDGSAGSGGGDGDGSGGSGDGSAGSGNGDGSGSGNGAGGGDGSGSGRGTGSSDRTHDYVSIPNGLGDDGALTGNQGSKEDSDYYRQQNGLAWEGEHVDYNTVIGSYTDRAYEGLAGGRYPSGMEEVIKGYFEGLNQ